MDTTNPYARFAPVMIFLVMALGAVNWYLAPEFSTKWALSIFFLPVMWAGVVALKMIGSNTEDKSDISYVLRTGSNELLSGITGAGLILAISLTLKLAQSQAGLSEILGDRLSGAAIGGVLIVMGNYIPKKLQPLGARICGQKEAQAMQRFSGWAFVLGGMVYSLAWLFLPPARSDTVATSAVVISVLLVMSHWLWVSFKANRS